jgi:iron complex transport system ATP-binding protein
MPVDAHLLPLALVVVLDTERSRNDAPRRPREGFETPVARLRSCSVRLGGRDPILDQVDLTVEPGSRWVVLGPNGSGKSTLLSLLLGERFPTAGTVELFGHRLGRVDVRTLRRRIGATPSGGRLRLRPEITTSDLVVSARDGALEAFWGVYSEAERHRAAELLSRFGVPGPDRSFGSLSDGEQTRALIARALFPDPELLVLDEPAQGLDLGGREQLVEVLAQISEDAGGPAVVLVTHALEEIPPGFTHALALQGGRVLRSGPLDAVLRAEILSACFGIPLHVTRRGGRWSAVAGGRGPERSSGTR